MSPATEQPVPPNTIGPARRVRVRVFILLAIVAQLLIPLTYYLRDDPDDERFAWRMFSGVRLKQCELSVFETRGGVELAVNPYHVVPAGWVEGLKRNRRRVVERFMSMRCDHEGTSQVRVERRCVEVDGTQLPAVEVTRDCARGESAP